MWVAYALLLLPALWAEPTEDLITEPLPNMKDPINFRQFSGYLNISEYKQLFYWYVESQNDPANDPVVLWLNGGPGCSSLQGLLLELGPFRVSDWGNTVTTNPMSWNRYSNIIFLDAPAGVGFSVRTDGLYNFTDDEVADDNHQAMLKWYEKFPERKTNDLFIMGESYAGTYIPMLSNRLIDDKTNFPMFKGMSVGNGCLDDRLLWNSQIQFNYYHSLIDETYYMQANQLCCQNTSSTECDYYDMVFVNFHVQCHGKSILMNSANILSGLDPYFLYFTCYLDQNVPTSSYNSQRDVMIRHLRKKMAAKLPDGVTLPALPKGDDPEHPDYDPNLPPCAHYDDYSIWLQLPELRPVLHIPDSVPPYQSCSTPVEDNYISQYDTMTPFVQKAVDSGLRVMFFNGDHDSVCNVQHNSQFIARLGYALKKKSHAWNNEKEQPAAIGYWTEYDGLDFVTIRGAGHFASSDDEKPRESLQMFYNYIKGTDYSTLIPSDTTNSTTVSQLPTQQAPTSAQTQDNAETTQPQQQPESTTKARRSIAASYSSSNLPSGRRISLDLIVHSRTVISSSYFLLLLLVTMPLLLGSVCDKVHYE